MGLFASLREPLVAMVDMMARFLTVQQPALAGVPSESLLGNAMAQTAAQQTIYNSSSSNHSESFNVPIAVHINANGMTPEQAETAVRRGVQDALKGAINSSRGNIPAPEVRRY
jgi:hypothetical protein